MLFGHLVWVLGPSQFQSLLSKHVHKRTKKKKRKSIEKERRERRKEKRENKNGFKGKEDRERLVFKRKQRKMNFEKFRTIENCVFSEKDGERERERERLRRTYTREW